MSDSDAKKGHYYVHSRKYIHVAHAGRFGRSCDEMDGANDEMAKIKAFWDDGARGECQLENA